MTQFHLGERFSSGGVGGDVATARPAAESHFPRGGIPFQWGVGMGVGILFETMRRKVQSAGTNAGWKGCVLQIGGRWGGMGGSFFHSHGLPLCGICDGKKRRRESPLRWDGKLARADRKVATRVGRGWGGGRKLLRRVARHFSWRRIFLVNCFDLLCSLLLLLRCREQRERLLWIGLQHPTLPLLVVLLSSSSIRPTPPTPVSTCISLFLSLHAFYAAWKCIEQCACCSRVLHN